MPASLFVQQVSSYLQSITVRQALQQTVFDVVSTLTDSPALPITPITQASHLLQRAEEYQVATHTAVVASILYVHRFLRMTQTQLTSENSVPVLTTALCIANKFTEDQPYDNATFSQLSGIPVPLLAQLELHFLAAVRFRLNVDPDNFQQLMDTFSNPLRTHSNSSANTSSVSLSVSVSPASAAVITATAPNAQVATPAHQRAHSRSQSRSRTPSTASSSRPLHTPDNAQRGRSRPAPAQDNA